MSNIVHKENGQRASVLQHVSQNVRRLRHAAQLSQTTLAELSGVSRRMLVAIEAGEKNVSLTTLDRVAEALDVARSEEHTSELQSLMSISYAVLCLKKNKHNQYNNDIGCH